jgi:hypothetical protein
MDSAAAWATAGTLGGVMIAGVLGLLTTHFDRKWQHRRSERDHLLQVRSELRLARRQAYVRYIISAQELFSKAVELHAINRGGAHDKAKFGLQPPTDLAKLVHQCEACRVVALLVAGDSVGQAISAYEAELRRYWQETASGFAESPEDDREEQTYHELIHEMRHEVQDV